MNFKKINKIQSAKNYIESAISMFTKAASDIDSANKLLEEVKQTGLSEKERLNNRINAIDTEISEVEKEVAVNNELKEKLQMFLPNRSQ